MRRVTRVTTMPKVKSVIIIPPARNWHPKLREAQFGVAVSTLLLNLSLDVAAVRQQLFNVRDIIIFTKEELK